MRRHRSAGFGRPVAPLGAAATPPNATSPRPCRPSATQPAPPCPLSVRPALANKRMSESPPGTGCRAALRVPSQGRRPRRGAPSSKRRRPGVPLRILAGERCMRLALPSPQLLCLGRFCCRLYAPRPPPPPLSEILSDLLTNGPSPCRVFSQAPLLNPEKNTCALPRPFLHTPRPCTTQTYPIRATLPHE